MEWQENISGAYPIAWGARACIDLHWLEWLSHSRQVDDVTLLFWDRGPLFWSLFWIRERATNSNQRSIWSRLIVNCQALDWLVWYPQCFFLSSTRWFLPRRSWHSRACRGGIQSHRNFLKWYWNSYKSNCSSRTCFSSIFYWRCCRWSQLIS